MTSGLVNASFSLPEWQAVKMIFFAPCTDSLYIGSNLNLSTTATSTALHPQLPKKPLHKGQFFQRLTNKSGMVRKFDPYGALMIIYVRGEQHVMLFSPNKNCHITPPPPHNDHPSTTATFFGPQSGCFGEVWLYKILSSKWYVRKTDKIASDLFRNKNPKK